VVDDRQDLDEAEGGPQASQGRRLVGVDLDQGPSRLALRGLVASGPQVQVEPAALELKLVDLALALILAAGLERGQFGRCSRCRVGSKAVRSGSRSCRCQRSRFWIRVRSATRFSRWPTSSLSSRAGPSRRGARASSQLDQSGDDAVAARHKGLRRALPLTTWRQRGAASLREG
jgi:hypothetical protein